jgi:hypothetical protein
MTSKPLHFHEPIEDRVRGFLRRHKKEGALWTGDIADALREPTPKVRRALGMLVQFGVVRLVVPGGRGLPSSWISTEE